MQSSSYKSPHIRDYTLRIILLVLRNFGFETLKVVGTNICPSESRFSQWLAERFPRFGEKILVLARKKAIPSEKMRETIIFMNMREFLNAHANR
jgi:hypothetical protein